MTKKWPGSVLVAATLATVALLVHSLALAHGVPQHELNTLARDGNLAYVWLGAKHMVTGYDHLLFLFGSSSSSSRSRSVTASR
jgi:hypothetical protein